MARVHIIGMGLDGWASLPQAQQQLIAGAQWLSGSDRLLATIPHPQIPRWPWQQLARDLPSLVTRVETATVPPQYGVIVASGDPLFFGIGRLLLQSFPADWLCFHPQVSSIQLAFSRLKLPWQDAQLVSVHGRSLEALIPILKAGHAKIGILTDPHHSPVAIAQLIQSLDLPSSYHLWICENLGDETERIQQQTPQSLCDRPVTYASLTVVILLRTDPPPQAIDPAQFPLFGLPDSSFASFPDQPGLMTKREIRMLALGELALAPNQIIWDIGAGTGSLSVEIARLVPSATVFAIEKTAIGQTLIQQNRDRFHTSNLRAIAGTAPNCFADLPCPDRIFIGGSGGQLIPILDDCADRLSPQGVLVAAIATLEHFALISQWIQQQKTNSNPGAWHDRYVQAQISRSAAFAHLNRWLPLNPITLIILTKSP